MITLILFSYSIRKFSLVLVLFFVLAILVAISKRVTYSRFKIRKARYYNNQKLETLTHSLSSFSWLHKNIRHTSIVFTGLGWEI